MAILFEQWAKTEIARLRTEADALQRALDKYLEAQRTAPAPYPSLPAATGQAVALPVRRAPRKKTGYGTKTAFVMNKIDQAGTEGITTDQLVQHIADAHMGIKRSSLRSMLWNARVGEIIEHRDGRWYRRQEQQQGPSA